MSVNLSKIDFGKEGFLQLREIHNRKYHRFEIDFFTSNLELTEKIAAKIDGIFLGSCLKDCIKPTCGFTSNKSLVLSPSYIKEVYDVILSRVIELIKRVDSTKLVK